MILDDFYDNGIGDNIYRQQLNETEMQQRELEEKLCLIVAIKKNARGNQLKNTQDEGRQNLNKFKKNFKAVNDQLKQKEKDMQVNEFNCLQKKKTFVQY